MRNSNNAIKFLLAQYRAIFKRAYIKGLASAVILTATLAAGQAQAADLTTSSGWTDGKDIITGSADDNFKVSTPTYAESLTVKADHKLTTSGTIIVQSDATLSGDLTIQSGMILMADKSDNNQHVYSHKLTGNGADLTLTGNLGAASFELSNGTLVLNSGGLGNTNLTAYGEGWNQDTSKPNDSNYKRDTANGTLSSMTVTVNSGTNRLLRGLAPDADL